MTDSAVPMSEEGEEGDGEDEFRITPEFLRTCCRKHSGYDTPSLNEKLYLHCQMVHRIEGLEEYTGLRCLWLQSNAISRIEGLDHLVELRCLYLHENILRRIEHLSPLRNLRTLNVANNYIESLSGIEECPSLDNLNVSANQLSELDGILPLSELENLTVLDISKNRIDDPDILPQLIVPHFGSRLRLLRLTGNPVVRKIQSYRRKMICAMTELKSLDNMPVFGEERRASVAWERGGIAEERLERKRIAEEKRRRDERNFAALDELMKKAHEAEAEEDQAGEEQAEGEQGDEQEGEQE